MEEIYISMKDAAELEGMLYRTFMKQVSRREENAEIVLRKEKILSGGKERKYIKLTDLSPKAQKAYRAMKKIDTEEGSDIVMEKLPPEEPWYLDTDVNWYIENHSQSYYKAVELSRLLQDIINYSDADKTEYIIRKAAELGMSQRTLYRHMDKYLEAAGWALKMLRETGANYDYYKVLCLCRKPKDSNTFPTFTPEVKQKIHNIWFDKDFARNEGKRQMLYDKLLKIGTANGWPIPSYQSVCRYISHLMADGQLESAHFLAAKGDRAWKNKRMVKALRDTRSLRVMEVLLGDEHTFDCWVSYKLPNGKVTAIKPKLVAWIDARSRMVLGDIICRDANAQILKQSLIKVLYGTPGGMPKYLNIDNGKDYTSRELTGVKRYPTREETERYAGFEEVKAGFYHTIGIEDFHRSRPYEPWSKSEIERLFKTVCDGFSRWFKSYTGTLTGSRTSAKIDKDIKRMLEQGKLLTMEEFYEKWSHYLHNVYAVKVHRGLKNQGETYCTPQELFDKGERYEKALPPKSFALLQLMKSERARVYNVGIRKFGQVYNHPELIYYMDKPVDIKYDPEDVTRLLVFDAQDGHMICEAESQELLKIAHKVPQEALERHIRLQKQQMKDVREKLKEMRCPLDERIAGAAQANTIVGSMMIEGAGNSRKVITLPKEESYREHRKTARQSEYIARQGREALEKLRNMG